MEERLLDGVNSDFFFFSDFFSLISRISSGEFHRPSYYIYLSSFCDDIYGYLFQVTLLTMLYSSRTLDATSG